MQMYVNIRLHMFSVVPSRYTFRYSKSYAEIFMRYNVREIANITPSSDIRLRKKNELSARNICIT